MPRANVPMPNALRLLGLLIAVGLLLGSNANRSVTNPERETVIAVAEPSILH